MSQDPNRDPESAEQDQDAEPSLNAPGDAGPTGITAEPGPVEGGTDDADDQDAEPTQHAPESDT